MSRIYKFEVENFKRIRSIAFDLKRRITELAGKNGVGKSSVLDALWVLFKGLSVAPVVPIRDGAEVARIRGELGELIVERVFRRKGENEFTSTLTVSNPDGAKFPSPQKKLDELIGAHMLDPLDFCDNMDDKKQFDVLRRFVPDVDFPAIDAANKRDYDERTDVNRRAKQAREAAAAIKVADEPPAQRVDEAALVAQIQKASDQNSDIAERRANRAAALQRITSLRETARSKLDEIETRQTEILQQLANNREDIEAQIKALQARLARLEDEATEKMTAIRKRLQEESTNASYEADELQARLDKADALPAEIDTAALAAKLNEARESNRAIDEWAADKRRRDELNKTADALEKQSDELTARITERTQQKLAAIAKATLPVDGLGFGDGVVTFKGLPFSQASRAEQLRTATAISLAMNPKLPIVWIRDGSLLDDDSLAIVQEQAEKYDGYVIVETVRAIGSDAIVIEDGRVKSVEQKDEAA